MSKCLVVFVKATQSIKGIICRSQDENEGLSGRRKRRMIPIRKDIPFGCQEKYESCKERLCVVCSTEFETEEVETCLYDLYTSVTNEVR